MWIVGNILSFVGSHHPPSCAPDCEALALSLLDMPFLESIEVLDARATQSLESLLPWEDHRHVHTILSHPALQDGISDDLAPIIAIMGGMREVLPEYLDILLDPAQTSPQKRTVLLPLAGTVDLVGIVPGKTASHPDVSRTMDILEHSIRVQEEFMGAAYPDPQMLIYIFDRGYGGGDYVRSSINSSFISESIIAHEAGHAYTWSPAVWINEGGADFLDSITQRTLSNRPLPEPVESCGTLNTIAEIIERGQNDQEIFLCNYSLGEALFLDLYQRLGDEAFREGYRNLYLLTFTGRYEDEDRDSSLYTGPHAGLSYVRAAFVDSLAPDKAAIAAEVINHHYHGTFP